MKSKELRLIGITLACWGLLFVGTGVVMNSADRTLTETTYTISVSQNKVAESKTNEIKLKEVTSEIDKPLSSDIKDYLDDIDNLDSSILSALKLDTSAVKPNEAGTYTYTISFKKKKYNGTYKVTEKKQEVTFTLKNPTIEKNSVLDAKVSSYIEQTLPEEALAKMILNLSAVRTDTEGTYQYTVTYDGKLYTGNITVIAPKNVVLPGETADDNQKEEDNNQPGVGNIEITVTE